MISQWMSIAMPWFCILFFTEGNYFFAKATRCRHPFEEKDFKKMSSFIAQQKLIGWDGQPPFRPELGSFPMMDQIISM